MFKWIEKKDLTYWIIIILIIWLINTKYDTTLDQWAFAGTIISIILAVLAIIYSFDQSSTTLYSTRKLEESAKKIEDVTRILKRTSVDDLINNLEARIESLNQTFDESIKSNLQKHHKDIESLLSTGFRKTNSNNLDLISKEEWEEYLKDILTDVSISGIVLLFSYLTYVNNLKLDFWSLSTHIVNNKTGGEDSEIKTINNILLGAFSIFSSLNVFRITEIEGNEIIIFMSDNFNQAIQEVLPTIKDSYLVDDLTEFISNKKGH